MHFPEITVPSVCETQIWHQANLTIFRIAAGTIPTYACLSTVDAELPLDASDFAVSTRLTSLAMAMAYNKAGSR